MNPPPRVDRYLYWSEPPPEPSPRLLWWQQRFRDGFSPNKRVRSMGYDAASEWYGVYIWEYINVLAALENSSGKPSRE